MLSQHRRAFANTVLALDLFVVGTAIVLAGLRSLDRPAVIGLELAAATIAWVVLSARVASRVAML